MIGDIDRLQKEIDNLRPVTRGIFIPDVRKVYGANGTGSGDDTVALQAYIDDVEADGGGLVYLPSGTYRITTGLTIDSNYVSLLGDGYNATQLYLDNATGNTLYLNGGVGGISGISISNLMINSFASATSTRTAGSSIKISNVGNFALRDLWLRHGWNSIYCDHAFTGVFDTITIDGDNTIAGGGLNDGVTLADGCIGNLFRNVGVACTEPFNYGFYFDTDTDGVVMEYCTVMLGKAAVGLFLDNNGNGHDPRWVRVTDCFFEADPTAGLEVNLEKSYDAELRGCYLEGSKYGLVIGSGANVVRVIGGVVTLCQEHGIAMNAGKNVLIEGVDISDNSQKTHNTYYGIAIAADFSDFRIQNCRIGDQLWNSATKQAWGIYIGAGASDHYLIYGNDVHGNVSGAISDNGTGVNKILVNLTA